MPAADNRSGVSRRSLLIGGGAGAGLLVAWALWPRSYSGNLTAAKGETVLGAWIKIGEDGHVTVAVPQAELGQGSWTALAQVAAGELGADWRQVGVEPAPLNPLFANPMGWRELFEGTFDRVPARLLPGGVEQMLTVASTSVRRFERPVREAAAGARLLLCKAAARRWSADWQQCTTAGGFVLQGTQRLRFGELAAAAAQEELPDRVTLRAIDTDALAGKPLPRIDVPAKVDGSVLYAADVRLAGMVYASIRQAPTHGRMIGVDRKAAAGVQGVLTIVERPEWVAAVANTWWAANRALEALAPRFRIEGPRVDSATIEDALTAALDGPGYRMAQAGDLSAVFAGARLITAEYRVTPLLHAPIETSACTASFEGGRLELWLPTQAPGRARAVAAAAIGIAADQVTVHPTMSGGSFGARLEQEVAGQAAVLAQALKRPVQLMWSRSEEIRQDRMRPPAAARMAARLGPNGAILGWLAKIAAPSTGRELAGRLSGNALPVRALVASGGDRYIAGGAMPPYRIPALAIDHHPAAIGIPTGHWQAGAHGLNAFFRECFIDELAHAANIEALSFRIAMLGGDPRLARCLSTAASIGGWEGGVAGSGQGIACHSFRGSYIAVLAEAHIDKGKVVVDRLVAAVDCGRQINADLVRQSIEGGLVLGMSAATGSSTGFTRNLPDARGLGDLALPRPADIPDITVELIASDAEPGGVSELGVPAVAPAIANALRAAAGVRLRRLPLLP